MKNRVSAVIESVSQDLAPTTNERRRVEQTFAIVEKRILAKASQLSLKVEVQEVGSVGKDTWVRGEADLDAFIIFPEGTRPSAVEKYGLQLGRYASGGKFTVAYAEHPYIRAKIRGVDVDIVPCVGVKDPANLVTAVDRTPFHKEFVIGRLNTALRQGVRLLKRLMLTLGIYGAEIRVKGFSGYLAELLVIHYGGFTETLEAASTWREGIVLDIVGSYKDLEDARTVFPTDPLIVIDPVDRGRNVAAAVTLEKMAIFVSAAREFLDEPSHFYFTHHPGPISPTALKRRIERESLPLIGVQTDCPRLIPDVLWGQLYKSLAGLVTLLERYDFTILHGDVWTDETASAVFLLELESMQLPHTFTRRGPTVYMKDEATQFVNKHIDSRKVVAGPWIQGDRWFVQLERKTPRAEVLLKERLREARLGSEIEKMVRRRKRIELQARVVRLAGQKKAFLIFLDQFLRRRPIWLEWRSKLRQKNT